MSIEERARLVKGHVTIDSELQQGTRVEVRVPLQAVHDPEDTDFHLQKRPLHHSPSSEDAPENR